MKWGFTLIELLVVIAIIAILAVVVVLVLNPAQLLAQSRDANRISDLSTLNNALNLYETDRSGASSSIGNASTSYISIPSSASDCSVLGMATSAYDYACATSAGYRSTGGAGWIPVDFLQISAGTPMSAIPADPVNQSSSGLYYAYETNGNQYRISAFMESAKYAKNMTSDGGADPALYEVGSGIAILPDASRSLAGYWPLNEGSGGMADDWSGHADGGTWKGTASGPDGFYGSGEPWQWGGYFNGSNNWIGASLVNPSTIKGSFTVTAWFRSSSTASNEIFSSRNSGNVFDLQVSGTMVHSDIGDGSTWFTTTADAPYAFSLGTWYFVAETVTPASYSIYVNGNRIGGSSLSGGTPALWNPSGVVIGAELGTGGQVFAGAISDVRAYDRALSAAEIEEIYDAEK